MEKIKLRCPECDAKVAGTELQFAKPVKCPGCKNTVVFSMPQAHMPEKMVRPGCGCGGVLIASGAVTGLLASVAYISDHGFWLVFFLGLSLCLLICGARIFSERIPETEFINREFKKKSKFLPSVIADTHSDVYRDPVVEPECFSVEGILHRWPKFKAQKFDPRLPPSFSQFSYAVALGVKFQKVESKSTLSPKIGAAKDAGQFADPQPTPDEVGVIYDYICLQSGISPA